jgi:hypothetical protein
MVIGFFRRLGHAVDEAHGGPEIGKMEGSHQFTGFNAPGREGTELQGNFRWGKYGHGLCSGNEIY